MHMNGPVSAEAVVVLHREESPLDLHLSRLTEFSGIRPRMLRVGQPEEGRKLMEKRPYCMMVSASSLAAILEDKASSAEAVRPLLESTPFILVYGITPTGRESRAVTDLTDGLISAVISCDRSEHSFQVSRTAPQITAEFSGLTFGPSNAEIDFGLAVKQPTANLLELVSINNLPTFAFFKRRNSSVFLLACRDIADPAASSDGFLLDSARKYFSGVVPTLMFLRYVYGNQNWHNPRRTANLIIDDPLLRRSYGFLNYSRLVNEMDRCDLAITVGFIPSNHRRTYHSTARLIKEHSNKFQICVHGSDHTKEEFATTNVEELNTRIRCATQRMRSHERRTGVPYAQVMVFPQGKFSSVSLSLLKSHNYLAALNSTITPEDLGSLHGLTLGDLLSPAVCRYSSFPLFARRYPKGLANIAFDLFLSKPALFAEHHDYFKDGYDKIREFAIQVNSLSERLQWTGLEELIERTYLQRRVSADTVACRIFGNRHVIDNPEPTAQRFIILKKEDGETPLQNVTLNGSKHPYELEGGYLTLYADVPAASAVAVAIDYRNTHPYDSGKHAGAFKQQLNVSLRRYLSEVRDNYLSKHDKLLSLAYRIKDRKSFHN